MVQSSTTSAEPNLKLSRAFHFPFPYCSRTISQSSVFQHFNHNRNLKKKNLEEPGALVSDNLASTNNHWVPVKFVLARWLPRPEVLTLKSVDSTHHPNPSKGQNRAKAKEDALLLH